MKLAKKLITLASIGGLSLTVIHFINKFISYSSTLDDLLSEDEEKTYKFSASLLEKRGFLSAKIVAR